MFSIVVNITALATCTDPHADRSFEYSLLISAEMVFGTALSTTLISLKLFYSSFFVILMSDPKCIPLSFWNMLNWLIFHPLWLIGIYFVQYVIWLYKNLACVECEHMIQVKVYWHNHAFFSLKEFVIFSNCWGFHLKNKHASHCLILTWEPGESTCP